MTIWPSRCARVSCRGRRLMERKWFIKMYNVHWTSTGFCCRNYLTGKNKQFLVFRVFRFPKFVDNFHPHCAYDLHIPTLHFNLCTFYTLNVQREREWESDVFKYNCVFDGFHFNLAYFGIQISLFFRWKTKHFQVFAAIKLNFSFKLINTGYYYHFVDHSCIWKKI